MKPDNFTSQDITSLAMKLVIPLWLKPAGMVKALYTSETVMTVITKNSAGTIPAAIPTGFTQILWLHPCSTVV